MAAIPTKLLNNGARMPVVGLGTWKTSTDDVGAAVKTALTQAGYRHVDGAFAYGNEKAVGQAFGEIFKGEQVKRQDVFITSKIWGTHHQPDLVRVAFKQTLADLQLDYLDLYLIHWPLAFKFKEMPVPAKELITTDDLDYLDTWKEMEKLVDEGLVKVIGVSNFNSEQVQRLLDNSRIKPAVIHVESHVFMTNQPLIDFCLQRGLVVIGFSPFASPDRPWAKETDPKPLQDATVKAIAEKHGRSPAQVLLRFSIQRGLAVLAKSTNLDRMKQNLEIFDFELTPEEMSTLSGLDANSRVCPGQPHWRDSKFFPWRP